MSVSSITIEHHLSIQTFPNSNNKMRAPASSSSPGQYCATTVAVVLLLAASSVAAIRVPTKDDCEASDKAALLAIKAAFGNNASYFESWTPEVPCCYWNGVGCDISAPHATPRRVQEVVFARDDTLVGPFPGAAIARLTALQSLTLIHMPGVYGPIPHDLVRLNGTLNSLDISYTGVSGGLPAFISKLTKLTYLRLSFNPWLTGPIPASLGELPNLSFLDLGRNGLTGPIPASLLSKTADASYLCLSHNNLTGDVPAAFAAVRFASVDLSHNTLSGDGASVLFGADKSELDTLDLSRNAFSFNLSAVTLPPRLVQLDLSHNDIYGALPPQVADLPDLMYLNVSYNRLSGVVPTGGVMSIFDRYCFQHNEGLCGTPLPPCKNSSDPTRP